MEQNDRILIRNLVIATVMGILMSRLSIGSMLMTVPLLIACYHEYNIKRVVTSFVVLLLAVVTWIVIEGRDLLGTEYWPYLLVALLVPVATIIGSAVWAGTKSLSSSLMRRFFWACIPTFVMGLVVALFFTTKASEPTKQLMEATVLYLFPSDQLGIDISSSVALVVQMACYFYAPLCILMLAISVVISDCLSSRNDQQWQFDFANMKFPDSYVWVFLVSLVLVLVHNFVPAIPEIIGVIVWNLALSMAILYGVAGVSILVALARKRSTNITATRIVATVFVFCLLPGLNIIVLLGLPILGVLETWIKFR